MGLSISEITIAGLCYLDFQKNVCNKNRKTGHFPRQKQSSVMKANSVLNP